MKPPSTNNGTARTLVLTPAVNDFLTVLSDWPLKKPTMGLEITHVKRNDLPTYVFPGGVRPPPPPRRRRSGSQKASQTAKKPPATSRSDTSIPASSGVSTVAPAPGGESSPSKIEHHPPHESFSSELAEGGAEEEAGEDVGANGTQGGSTGKRKAPSESGETSQEIPAVGDPKRQKVNLPQEAVLELEPELNSSLPGAPVDFESDPSRTKKSLSLKLLRTTE